MAEDNRTAEWAGTGAGVSHLQINVHVHLAGLAAAQAPAPDLRREEVTVVAPSGGPSLRRRLLNGGLLAALIFGVGVLGFRAGGVASQRQTASLASSEVGGGSTPPAPLPESLARALEQPPQVTPPVGARGASAGPSAFGLE